VRLSKVKRKSALVTADSRSTKTDLKSYKWKAGEWQKDSSSNDLRLNLTVS
jgi:hypothetical protein